LTSANYAKKSFHARITKGNIRATDKKGGGGNEVRQTEQKLGIKKIKKFQDR